MGDLISRAGQMASRFRRAILSKGIGIAATAAQDPATVAVVFAGAGVTTATEAVGSVYLRSNGPNAERIGTTWAPSANMAVIADPGDVGAVSVVNSGECAITTAGAETRTVAIPTFAGQLLALTLDVDGGECTATVAAAINQTGNNTLIAADAGDHILLQGVTVAGVLVWRLVANDGWALSTV